MSKLADALLTKTQQKVLQLLYGRPDRSFYTKEILRSTGMGVHTIKRELDRMEAAGILTKSKIGNQKHFQANPDCPLYEELVSIVKKTVGVADVLRDVLAPVAGDIIVAFVYGSIAKGSERAESDIDLMIVANALNYTDLMGLLIPAQEKLKRPISPTIYTQTELEKKLQQGNNFLKKVLAQEKIPIIGDLNDIGKVK
ncbi:MAG: nucleotidyltransferase domain-containing protein [Anaerolineae bacterium]|nr:nucleotidyltransferase domain-containing protein [Anaerolineae bacterium]MDK1119599.1 nucleotidyltransferase domain-containing protein [Anaerolineae bacterium]